MSDATYAGAVIMEVNGRDVEIISIKPQTTTGRKPVKTMNRQGRVLGYADGVTEHKLSLTAAIPIDGTEIDWDNITKAKITPSTTKADARLIWTVLPLIPANNTKSTTKPVSTLRWLRCTKLRSNA